VFRLCDVSDLIFFQSSGNDDLKIPKGLETIRLCEEDYDLWAHAE
jgi:hypothetical protein